MSMFSKVTRTTSILATTSVLALWAGGAMAQTNCALVDGVLPEGCTYGPDGSVVVMPAGENTERDSGAAAAAPEGFLISVDGQPVTGDKRVEDIARQADIDLAAADVRVQFDGLGARPALDLKIDGAARSYQSGETATVRSYMNYPAFVTRGEVRVVDVAARGGPRLVGTYPVDPNGTASFVVPQGERLILTHRVYDAKGRYDETAPIALSRVDEPSLDVDAEEGSTYLARQRIPVSGGAVTVSGSGVAQGATVRALGTQVTPDPSGRFVIQRILPAGDRSVEVELTGGGRNTYIQRDITIPRSEWFYVATADLTFGRRFDGGKDAAGGDYDETYSYGRLAGYAKGKTQNGWELTASVDTGDEDLDQIFENLDKKDPYHLLLRLDDERAYPTFGDDSTIEDGAPTSGKVYLRAEKDGSHLMWGNYKSTINGSKLLRNERTLYGFQGLYVSPETTSRGQSKVRLEAYAAQPDNLPGRDVFRGTGGSVYFLQKQDLSIGSETLSIELRDRDTGRVVETRTLTYGRDYDINYIQGLITLARPLSSSTGSGTVITDPSGDYDIRLVAQYEFTPTATDVDGFSYGARAEVWATDNIRIGATGLVEQTGSADQTATGVDLRYEFSERSYIDLEYAQTEGPGFGSSISSDGGLIVTNSGAVSGDGEAYLVSGQLDLREAGAGTDGTLAFYYESRTEGFSTLDYQTSVSEDLWGVSVDIEASERLSYRAYFDSFENKDGKKISEGGVEATYRASDRVTWDLGLEHLDKTTPNDADNTGSRTDIAARVTFTENADLAWYVFGQATLSSSGGLKDNNRLGAGVKYRFAKNWTFEGEISDGDLGEAGRALFSYAREDGTSAYFGYELIPSREFSGVSLSGRDRGQFVAGGKRQVTADTEIYGENTYDIFGTHRSLTSTYGVSHRRSDFLTYDGSVEFGKIDDPAGDFDRTAISLGMRYQDEAGLSAKARLELRQDRGTLPSGRADADTILLTAAVRYKIDDERRLVFNLDAADTDTRNNSVLSGEYVEASLGYAYRPILDDKLNLLLKYTYLYDMYGQQIDGNDEPGPRQESHVFSLDASYDLNPQWTLGGKLGARLSRSAPNASVDLAKNDAWLGVVNARYHVTHKWDVLVEGRYLAADQAGFSEYGLLGAAYRHVGNNVKVGVGYNFGSFSDDLTDLTYDDKGLFVNFVAKF
ncbi:hypothetical protein [Algirhabdus cladophorae]|uniref:hypothetical protein n=1 Tax=Algirhabdus cladophorae TaxID=3377108 RepID=UPI003B847C49